MSNEQNILELLNKTPGLKAKDIARELGLEKRDVNSALYGRLKTQLTQDKEYRWWPKGSRPKSESRGAEEQKKLNTPLARLSRYYLDCLSQDNDQGVSAFASSKYDLDYVPLEQCPLVEESDQNVFDGEAAKKLLNKVRKERSRLAIYLGFPVRLRHMRSKRGWEGYMMEPVFLFPFTTDSGNRYATPELSDDMPLFNFAVLRSLMTFGSGNLMDEAIQLAEELGLTNPDGELPDLDEICPRLRAARPEWDWREEPDPYDLVIDPPLDAISEQGIYNRAVLVTGERSPFTQGLETELGQLAKVTNAKSQNTALSNWLAGSVDTSTEPNDQPLLEALPLNTEQRQAVQQALTNKLTVITGPPGTGKSQVVTSLLINAAWQGQSVLFASKNNKAVDVVEERVNSLGPRPILLRMGANEYQNRLAQYLTAILAATSTSDDQSNFDHHLEVHEQLRVGLDRLDQEMAALVKLRNSVDESERSVEAARGEFGDERFAHLRSADLSQLQSSLTVFAHALRQATRAEQDFLTQLFWFFVKNGRYERLTNESQPVQPLASQLGVLLPDRTPDDLTISEWRRFHSALVSRLQKASDVQSYFSALGKLNDATSLEDSTKQRMELVERLADNSEQLWRFWLRLQPSRMTAAERRTLSEYSSLLQMIVSSQEDNSRLGRDVFRKYYQLFPQIAKTLSCWAVTSLSARRIPFEPGFFDLVVVDEASQCDIASALPLLYRAKRAVIIGDPQQLRHISAVPIRQDRQLLAKHDLVEQHSNWAYSVNSLFDLSRSLCRGEDIVSLRDHHRSHAEIIGFSNENFYEGRLRVATRYDRLHRPQGSDPAVRWVNTKGKVIRPAAGGAINDLEARAVVDEIRELVMSRGYRGTVGVVSPFRAQANRIRDLVNQDDELTSLLSVTDFLVDTVHRFQGDERDLILFSPVISEGVSDGALGFLRSNRNLFNVAITRARAALVVVGDKSAALHSGVDYLSKFASYVDEAKHLEVSNLDELRQGLGPDYPTVARPDRVSDWERHFYRVLYQAGIRPIPQFGVEQYTLDFAVVVGEEKLDIEVDGERYHRSWDGELCRRDQLRNQRLFELDWDVMRFWVYQIRDDLDSCIGRVQKWVQQHQSHGEESVVHE